ncbi:MAG TPA: Lrp/AsnC ligand binding domain-containing protein [Candidatus Thermoplasmatota archaeon]|nr:Lrp/AsnC ligand binding domain-containing protein [Candidatus Thermoplasmatota archaeon]
MALATGGETETDLAQYYATRNVEAIILLKVETAKADDIADSLGKFKEIQHAYLVTGEDDIVLKARFGSYRELKDFIIRAIGPLPGVEDTKTMMVVTTYKENGRIVG